MVKSVIETIDDDISKDKFKDECGVFGVYINKPMDLISMVYYGLYALQHRGQESTGIAVADGNDIKIHKALGVITEAFDSEMLQDLKNFNGNISIGHVRYSTSGEKTVNNAQPLLTSTKLGPIAMAHNGNLVNSDVVKEILEETGHVFHTSVDSEVLSVLIARGAEKGIERSIVNAISMVRGSFAMLIMTKDKLIGIRDPNGIRPLCIGKIEEGYILASESCALDSIGAKFIRDVKPGEIVIIDSNGIKSLRYSENTICQTCAFEYIYFARPDSVIDGLDVYKTRIKQGEILFEENKIDGDLVIAVPDSGIPAAIGYSRASGIPYDLGFVKNKYVARTFITPSQEVRKRAISIKLNPIRSAIEGKRVIIIDDSIVRGSTSRHLVESLRRVGAKEVHFLVASPMVKYPCYFGIDTPCKAELIGANKSTEEIRKSIGCDFLNYLSIEGMYKSFDSRRNFCVGCFSGVYPISIAMEKLEDNL